MQYLKLIKQTPRRTFFVGCIICVFMIIIFATDNPVSALFKPDDGMVDISHPSVKFEPPEYCTRCTSGVPCEYQTPVRLRILVLAFNRDASLKACLENFNHLVTDGDKIALEIFIDITVDKKVHLPTLTVARQFASQWNKGHACVHVQTDHSYIAKQWLYAWRPLRDSGEMALHVEDDVDISPYAYKWLKTVNQTFGDDANTYGYSLQHEIYEMQVTDDVKFIRTEPHHSMYRYAIFGTYGFSPKANFWRDLQDWHLDVLKKNSTFKPVWKGILPNTWYQNFMREGREGSMEHEMWIHSYVLGHRDKMFCVFSNLDKMLNRENVYLSYHREEAGLHYSKASKTSTASRASLLSEWKDDYGAVPKDIVSFDSSGNRIRL